MAFRLPWSKKPPLPGITVSSDPLDVVPCIPQQVEARSDSKNNVQLRYCHPPKSRLDALVMRTLKLRKAIRVNLDERGSAFWRMIDGQHDLHWISGQIATKYDIADEQAKGAAVAFVRDLMLRGMVQLKVRPNNAGNNL